MLDWIARLARRKTFLVACTLSLVAVQNVESRPIVSFPATGKASVGCPINVRVIYEQDQKTFGRTYFGGTTYPGICAQKVNDESGKGVRDTQSIAGLWYDNAIAHPQDFADAILPILIAHSKSETAYFQGQDSGSGIFREAFSFVKSVPIMVDGVQYQMIEFEYTERYVGGSLPPIHHVFDRWVINPNDPNAPIFIGAQDAGGSENPENSMIATHIRFLNGLSNNP